MPMTLDQNETATIVALEGSIDISCAMELKTLLQNALASGRDVRVSAANATDLDVTAVQLLWAAAREARHAGVKFELGGQGIGSLSALASEAGMEAFPISV